MKTIGIYHFQGCGGCELNLMMKEEDIANLFQNVSFTSDHTEVDYALIFGKASQDELNEVSKRCQKLIFCGACGLKSYENLEDRNLNDRDIKGTYIKDTDTIMARGCPVSSKELYMIVDALIQGVDPKPKRQAVCVECRNNENICLLKLGQACRGPITYGGCQAKCTSIGVACRGCRGMLDNANEKLMDKLYAKYRKD